MKKKVYVLFGGSTAERQVSVMSGTNVWLKLLKSKKFSPMPFFLTPNNDVIRLPYTFALNHTAEEIWENCKLAKDVSKKSQPLVQDIRRKLDLKEVTIELPEKMLLEQFFENAKKDRAFVFLGLHGGMGEDGTIQKLLSEKNIPYNGSSHKTAKLCMDKLETAEVINGLKIDKVSGLPKITIDLNHEINSAKIWNSVKHPCIIKPRSDGCSAGVVRLYTLEDFDKYIHFLKSSAQYIPSDMLTEQSDIIELSTTGSQQYIIEEFLETDSLKVVDHQLEHKESTGWVELTCGILENNNQYKALNPSITVTSGDVLTVEEKFQGGTGVNLTPPPEQLISKKQRQYIKKTLEIIADKINIENYVRVDFFYNQKTDEIIIIEFNTLPALTPSTVIYQQALAEEIPQPPLVFLENIIESALAKF